MGKGLAVCDGCVCRLAGVRAVKSEGGLQKPLSKAGRWSELEAEVSSCALGEQECTNACRVT